MCKEKRKWRELKLEARRNAMCNSTLKPERSELDVRTVVAVLKSITSWCHRARIAYPALLFPAHLTRAVARSRRLFKVPFPPFFAGLLPSPFRRLLRSLLVFETSPSAEDKMKVE